MIKKIVGAIIMLLPILAILGYTYTVIEYGFVEAAIVLGWALFLIGCIGAYFLVN